MSDPTPEHYRSGMQVVELSDAFGLQFYETDVLKRLVRLDRKGQVETDLAKIHHELSAMAEKSNEKSIDRFISDNGIDFYRGEIVKAVFARDSNRALELFNHYRKLRESQ